MVQGRELPGQQVRGFQQEQEASVEQREQVSAEQEGLHDLRGAPQGPRARRRGEMFGIRHGSTGSRNDPEGR